MTAFALKVIDQAVDEATNSPIKPSPAIRLALAWLTLHGFTQAWQVKQFWHYLRHDHPGAAVENSLGPYIRSRDLRISLIAWQRAVEERYRG